MQAAECFARRVVPFTVNVTSAEEREKLNLIGHEIALKEGIRYEGYSLITVEPYSIEKAKAYLHFD